jgi:hypothetical protein
MKPLPPRHSSASAAWEGPLAVTLVVGARDPHGADRGGLGLDRQVGQDVAHRRLVDQQGTEGRAVTSVVDGLEGAPAQSGGRPQQTVKAGVVDHPDDRRNPATFLSDQRSADAPELNLGGGKRAGAELVLEPLELHPRPSLDQET